MLLTKWEARKQYRQVDEAINPIWWGFGVGRRLDGNIMAVDVDMEEWGDRVLVRASLPGVNPELIEVTVENSVLTIEGQTFQETEDQDRNYLLREISSGRFRRTVELPETLDSDNAESNYIHGVLTIKFPKIEAKRAKRLEVKTD